MLRKFLIKKDERGLLFRKGDFVTVLHAGEHRYFDPFYRLSVEKYPLAKTAFDHRLADYLRHAEPALIDSEFHVVEVGPTEVGLRYENSLLVEVIAPNTHRLYWKGYIDVRVARIDISENFVLPPDAAARNRNGPREGHRRRVRARRTGAAASRRPAVRRWQGASDAAAGSARVLEVQP